MLYDTIRMFYRDEQGVNRSAALSLPENNDLYRPVHLFRRLQALWHRNRITKNPFRIWFNDSHE